VLILTSLNLSPLQLSRRFSTALFTFFRRAKAILCISDAGDSQGGNSRSPSNPSKQYGQSPYIFLLLLIYTYKM